jgi:glycosyltransferase involved in cell wall biosynthesis
VHRVASPLRFVVRHGAGEGFRNRFLPFHSRPIRREIGAFLRDRTGVFVVHGVGPWGSIGTKVARTVQSADRRIVAITTIWSTMEHEHRGKIEGVSLRHGVAAWIRAHFEFLWFKLAIFPLDRTAFRRSHRLLVNYEAVADQLRQGGAPEESILVVPYATVNAFADPLAKRPEPEPMRRLEPRAAPMVVAVSRHDSRKGLDLLLVALGRLRESGIPFRACLVGPGPLLEAHRRLAQRLELEDAVEITGFAEDPVAYLQHADVFVLPSLEEGSGSLSMLEAMQAGVAVVASDVDGIPEDVTHGDSAELVAVGDVDALRATLERVLTDEALRARLGRRAREVFEERFSAAHFTQSVGTVYRELLEGAAGPG